MPSKPTNKKATAKIAKGTAVPTRAKATARAAGKNRLRWLDAAVALVAVSLVGYGLWQITSRGDIANNRQDCAEIGREYQVALSADSFIPSNITVSRCDRLVITNQGTEAYDLAFGTHDEPDKSYVKVSISRLTHSKLARIHSMITLVTKLSYS